MAVPWAERWQLRGRFGRHLLASGKAKAPNLVLRYIRETERRESRDEFAAAIVDAGRQLGDNHLACDARLVARWEDGDVECPRPAYQRALVALTGRPFDQLGFRARNAIEVPSTADLTSGRLALHVDEEGQVWATIGRRTFLVGTSAALLMQAGLAETGDALPSPPITGTGDPYGFGVFAKARWPGIRLARPHPDYGVDYTALLLGSRTVEGAIVNVQLQEAQMAGGWAVTTINDLLRWQAFARDNGRGLLVSACASDERARFFAIDSREARRRLHGGHSVPIPEAYELDDLTFALLWACASLDNGLQADDQELTAVAADLAPYEELPSSAVSREAAATLGATAHMWLGSDFCARHILRNMVRLPEVPVFWTREQTGGEACTWLLFDHKYAYLRATHDRFPGEPLSRMFCIPHRAAEASPLYERVANWVRGEGIWHVDTARRPSVLGDFREAAGYATAHCAIDAPAPHGRLRALAHYLGIDWAWLRHRCQQLAQAGAGGLLRPRSRHISTAGVDAACAYLGDADDNTAA